MPLRHLPKLNTPNSSDRHSRWNAAGFKNSSDDWIINFVIVAMFIVFSALWLAAFSCGWQHFHGQE